MLPAHTHLQGRQDGNHVVDGAPLILEDVQANLTVVVDCRRNSTHPQQAVSGMHDQQLQTVADRSNAPCMVQPSGGECGGGKDEGGGCQGFARANRAKATGAAPSPVPLQTRRATHTKQWLTKPPCLQVVDERGTQGRPAHATVWVEHLRHEADFGGLDGVVFRELHGEVECATLPNRVVGSG